MCITGAILYPAGRPTTEKVAKLETALALLSATTFYPRIAMVFSRLIKNRFQKTNFSDADLGWLGPEEQEQLDEWEQLKRNLAHNARGVARQIPVIRATIPFGTSRIAYIGLGSSVGDRPRYLQRAIVEISKISGVTCKALSDLYQTDPMGFVGRDFYNLVLEIETNRSPLQLLWEIQRIELMLGRVRTDGWAPRTIDVDILSIDGITIDIPHLKLPHPRLHERLFVLVPWLDLNPEPLPDGTTISQLYTQLYEQDPACLNAVKRIGRLADFPPGQDTV